MVDIDEDMIAYYFCIVCEGGVCKDVVSKYLDDRDVVCIDCDKGVSENGVSHNV